MNRYLVQISYADPVNFTSRPADGFVVSASSSKKAIEYAAHVARLHHAPLVITSAEIISVNNGLVEPNKRRVTRLEGS